VKKANGETLEKWKGAREVKMGVETNGMSKQFLPNESSQRDTTNKKVSGTTG